MSKKEAFSYDEFMNKAELPLISETPLPYLAVYRTSLSKAAWIPVIFLMISTVGLIISHGVLLAGFFLMEVISIIFILIVSVKTSKKKKATWVFLDEQHKEFIAAVSKRYGVTLTETILYSLAQGGETILSDSKGHLTRIMIESDPETQTTLLVESGTL